MNTKDKYDVIIVGGSYAGLSAAMALGRSLRKVLIIDSGEPCNRQTPHSHNFIGHDGDTPASVAAKAKEQVLKYPTVSFYTGEAVKADKEKDGFKVETEKGEIFLSRKIILTTGIKDVFPDIKGIKECWGISVLHCPYCHGYEVRDQALGIIADGEMAYHLVKLVHNLSKNLVLMTNGKTSLSSEQLDKMKGQNVQLIEKEIEEILHKDGRMSSVIFKDKSTLSLSAAFTKLAFEHSPDLYRQLGCELNEMSLIKTDQFYCTTVKGVYAAGDNSSMGRSLAVAIGNGSMAGAMANRDMTEEDF